MPSVINNLNFSDSAAPLTFSMFVKAYLINNYVKESSLDIVFILDSGVNVNLGCQH